jgi:preprotein translocase subunit SecE
MVVVMVVIVGILLWLLDMGLVWAVRLFTGAQ